MSGQRPRTGMTSKRPRTAMTSKRPRTEKISKRLQREHSEENPRTGKTSKPPQTEHSEENPMPVIKKEKTQSDDKEHGMTLVPRHNRHPENDKDRTIAILVRENNELRTSLDDAKKQIAELKKNENNNAVLENTVERVLKANVKFKIVNKKLWQDLQTHLAADDKEAQLRKTVRASHQVLLDAEKDAVKVVVEHGILEGEAIQETRRNVQSALEEHQEALRA